MNLRRLLPELLFALRLLEEPDLLQFGQSGVVVVAESAAGRPNCCHSGAEVAAAAVG